VDVWSFWQVLLESRRVKRVMVKECVLLPVLTRTVCLWMGRWGMNRIDKTVGELQQAEYIVGEEDVDASVGKESEESVNAEKNVTETPAS
jgi:cytochrome oxidase assembly protein ShyY1